MLIISDKIGKFWKTWQEQLLSSLYDKDGGNAAVPYAKDALAYQKDLALSFPKDVATPFLVTDILEDPYR